MPWSYALVRVEFRPVAEPVPIATHLNIHESCR